MFLVYGALEKRTKTAFCALRKCASRSFMHRPSTIVFQKVDGRMIDTATRRLMCLTSRCCPWSAHHRIPAVSVELLIGYARQNPLVRGSIIQSSAVCVTGKSGDCAQSIFKSCFQKCAAYVYIALTTAGRVHRACRNLRCWQASLCVCVRDSSWGKSARH